MYILGIETSCDDTAAAVIEAKGGFQKPSFSVLSNTSYSQVAIHKKFGGVVPNLASRAHLEKIGPTIKNALIAAKTKQENIDLIAVTRGPGLAPSLLVGINTARALAYAWQKPIIGVNHIEGHIYSNWLPPIGKLKTKSYKLKAVEFPALILIVSGGHTELVLMKNYGNYKIIGQTLDDAAGECFDKTARLLGLGFPGGPAIAAMAAKFEKLKAKSYKLKANLPRPMMDSKDYNFSFSGLKTAVLYLYNDLIKKYPKEKIVPAIAAETQQAIIDILVAKTLKATRNYDPKAVMIAGGVSANKKLREEMAARINPPHLKKVGDKIPLFVPDFSYSTDNAAMIAAAGYFNYLKKRSGKTCLPAGRDSWKNVEMNANLGLGKQ